MATFLLILGLAYCGGFLTAWYLYRPAALTAAQSKARTTVPVAQGKQAAVQPQQPPTPPASTGQDVPLSFYETLQKGNKSIIGSGLNPQKGQESPTAVRGSSVSPPAPQPVKKQPEPASSQAKPNPSPLAGEGKFTVQVASTKERKEADELVARLVAKGYAATASESKVEGKGTWFRVRVGRHLVRSDAEELVARLKSGAVVVQEKE
ncbi:SPOR domain-containing protein [Geobacter argillaceus]|uniref:Sporulation related protein n=1 Tax=Geobacter argillaceus TaxID=345631 RepID=A0A562VNS3_9BACT|nr:SPOR domain-containing protein [Geobacter argillaceus]TWJ19387.1 sporulation related protein [Geobacter argillaceus]